MSSPSLRGGGGNLPHVISVESNCSAHSSESGCRRMSRGSRLPQDRGSSGGEWYGGKVRCHIKAPFRCGFRPYDKDARTLPFSQKQTGGSTHSSPTTAAASQPPQVLAHSSHSCDFYQEEDQKDREAREKEFYFYQQQEHNTMPPHAHCHGTYPIEFAFSTMATTAVSAVTGATTIIIGCDDSSLCSREELGSLTSPCSSNMMYRRRPPQRRREEEEEDEEEDEEDDEDGEEGLVVIDEDELFGGRTKGGSRQRLREKRRSGTNTSKKVDKKLRRNKKNAALQQQEWKKKNNKKQFKKQRRRKGNRSGGTPPKLSPLPSPQALPLLELEVLPPSLTNQPLEEAMEQFLSM